MIKVQLEELDIGKTQIDGNISKYNKKMKQNYKVFKKTIEKERKSFKIFKQEMKKEIQRVKYGLRSHNPKNFAFPNSFGEAIIEDLGILYNSII